MANDGARELQAILDATNEFDRALRRYLDQGNWPTANDVWLDQIIPMISRIIFCIEAQLDLIEAKQDEEDAK